MRATTMREALAAVALAVVGVAFCVVGWQGLTAPEALLEPVGLVPQGARGRSEARAAYGGMHLGLGAFMLVAAVRVGARHVALWAATAMLGGLVFGRVFSLSLDGTPGSFPMLLLLLEGAGTGLCLGALAMRGGAPRAP